MWSAFDNLSNLASQAVQTAVQTTTEAVNLATDTVNQVATETLRKVSNDQDHGDGEDQQKLDGKNQNSEKKIESTEKTDSNETNMPNSCPVATDQDENTSETTKELTAQADQFADGFFTFASQLADEAYKNTLNFTTQAVEISNQAHAQISQQTGTLYTQILENEMVNNVVKTVEDKTILGDFHKEQSKHIETQNDLNSQSGLPWEGYESSEVLEDKIRGLSKDERNFRRNPPNGVSFTFDYKVSFPQALLVLESDEDLQKMRFLLVPKKMKEEIFWRNYFYRVSLIKQSYQLKELSGSRSSLNNLETSQEKDLLKYDKKIQIVGNFDSECHKFEKKQPPSNIFVYFCANPETQSVAASVQKPHLKTARNQPTKKLRRAKTKYIVILKLKKTILLLNF